MAFDRMLLAALLCAGAAPALAQAEGSPAPAQAEGSAAAASEAGADKLDIKDLRPASVPLVAAPLDRQQKSDPIWVKGDRPKANRIAAMTLHPVAAVVTEGPIAAGYANASVLSLAIVGETQGVGTRGAAERRQAPVYCGAGAGGHARRIVCLADSDRDGRLDRIAVGAGEQGDAPEQLSILAKMEPLAAPVAYRPARPEELPRIEAVFTNCGKDHDRPRYSLAVEGTGALSLARLLEMQASGNPATRSQVMAALAMLWGGAGGCRAAEPLPAGHPLHPAALDGGAVAVRLDALAIRVGPKDAGAPVTLLGLVEPDRLYRLSGSSLLPFEGHVTATQTALALKQKFARPVLGTTAPARAFEGDRKVGEVLLEGSFAHGYMGVLTADTTISTLLSSRSLPRGTLLYGVPMSSRLVMTRNGVPMTPTPVGLPSPEEVRLTWCVPVEEAGRWTATCLPDQGGEYTLLKGQAPAFEVTAFSYGTGMTTNSGAVPVAEEARSFERPLVHRFVLKELRHSTAFIEQQTVYGEAFVSSRVHQVPLETGRGALRYGGGVIGLRRGSREGTLAVSLVDPFEAQVEATAAAGLLPESAVAAAQKPPES